ncbi:MAG: hypothetical protein EXR71_00805 [Myxococcales bacterium]|nr:hypothetical protein [Myxococcales bacterium]
MTDDDRPELAPVSEGRMPLRIATQVAVAGAMLGGFEGLVVATRSALWLTAWERAQLTLTAALADATVAFAAGLVGGAAAWLTPSWQPLWRRYRRGFGVGWSALGAFFLLPMIGELARREEWKFVFGLSVVSVSVGLFGFLVAGYAYRREMIGLVPRVGFRLPGVIVVFALGAASAVVPQRREPLALVAPPHSTNVILVTLDTLRRDHLSVYHVTGGEGSPPSPLTAADTVATPNLDRLGREGAIFDLAVTPVPETAPSHASMFTGRHPSETKVIQNGRVLAASELTATEQIRLSGWRTAAFVSSFAVDSSGGLDQGFEVYDDDFAPVLRGVAEFRVGWLGLRLLLRYGNPADWPRLLERRGDRTVARALDWVATVPADVPIFLWVHLFDPHAPYEAPGSAGLNHAAILAQEPGYAYTPAEIEALRGQYANDVRYADAQVGALLDGLRAAGRLDEAAVLAVADHGESLGEHGIHFNHHGLYDEVLRVPLLLWHSTPVGEPGVRVAEQVSVLDVANTLCDAAGVPKLSGTGSVALQHRLRGSELRPEPLLLFGRSDTAWLYGVRAPAGVKYIQTDGGTEELYDLSTDPFEADNLVASQPSAVANGRAGVELLRRHIDREAGLPTDDTSLLLDALGYQDPTVRP